MKKSISKYILGTFFLLLLLNISSKKVFAAERCQFGSISINPGINTEDNTITITGNGISDPDTYNIQIWGLVRKGASHRIKKIIASGGKISAILKAGDPLLRDGEHRILLEHENKDYICEGTVSTSFPNDCEWSVNPRGPYANNPMTISVESRIIQYYKGTSLYFEIDEQDGSKKEFIIPRTGIFTYTPQTARRYNVYLKYLYPTDLIVKTLCYTPIYVGEDVDNPGEGIPTGSPTPPDETPEEKLKKLCNEESGPCTDCFKGEGQFQGKPGTWTALGCIPTNDLNSFAGWLLSKVIFIASGIAFLLMAFGAFQIITSSGDPKKTQAGSELITSALSGLLFIILSIFLLKLIGVDILRIPGFGQ